MIKFYKELDNIPVYNYYKLSETRDARYLIIGVDINQLPKISETESESAFMEFYKNLNECNLELQSFFYKALHLYYMFITLGTDEQKAHSFFNDYLLLLDKYFCNYRYDNQIFTNSKELRNYLRNKFNFQDYIRNRYKILKYNKIDADVRQKWDLYNDIILIKTAFNIDIDEYTCSMKKFNFLKQKSIEKIKNQK